LRSKVNTILPIALAIFLPGIGFLTNPDLNFPIGLYLVWFITSILLYLLWHILWYAWDLKTGNGKRMFIITLSAFVAILAAVIFLVSRKNSDDFMLYNSIRLILPIIIFLPIQFALKTQQQNSQLQIENEQMQTENYRAQLKALRAKIDPHFLFNSLNTLRSMVRQHHINAEKFIMSLSDFYRQTLKHNENTTLQVSEELEVLQSYLFLMKSRNEEAVSFSLDIDDSLLQFHVPTLALQTVVENCFKHNSMTSKRPLHIEINNTDDFYITVKNNIQPKIGDNDASGYGLELLKKRYELMNIQKGVIIKETPDYFSVQLKLL
jgi:two-component system LytT family sensor kinase